MVKGFFYIWFCYLCGSHLTETIKVETLQVSVKKGKIRQFEKLIAESGIAKIEKPTKKAPKKPLPGKFEMGKGDPEMTLADVFEKRKPIKFKYETLEQLRKDAWGRKS
jgi:hypothetical protein